MKQDNFYFDCISGKIFCFFHIWNYYFLIRREQTGGSLERYEPRFTAGNRRYTESEGKRRYLLEREK
jgi:hypothetical protein